MIPDITFKEFANKLFEKKDTPNLLYISAISGQPNYHFSRYPYTWEEIIDYIDRWLYNIPIYKIDVEVYSAIEILKEYNGVPFSNTIQNIENFELINKLKEFIKLKANEVKGKAEAEQREAKEVKKVKQKEQTEKKKEETKFENYLSCPEEQKKALMEKLRQLFKTAEPIKAYFILQALHSLEYFDLAERGRSKKIKAINNEFGTMYSDENINKPYREWKRNQRDDDQEITKFKNILTSD